MTVHNYGLLRFRKQAERCDNPRAIAAVLDARSIRMVLGGAWHDGTLRNLLAQD